MSRFVLVCGSIGGGVPILWLITYHLYPRLIESLLSFSWSDGILLCLWPFWVLMIGDPLDSSILLPGLAVALNSLFYGVFGALLWAGLNKSKVYIAVFIVLILVFWTLLISLYY